MSKKSRDDAAEVAVAEEENNPYLHPQSRSPQEDQAKAKAARERDEERRTKERDDLKAKLGTDKDERGPLGVDEFQKIKLRVEHGLMGVGQALDHMFNRMNGIGKADDFSDVAPPVVTGRTAPEPELTHNTTIDADKKTRDLADANANNLPTAITNVNQTNALAEAIAFDPDFADNLRESGGEIPDGFPGTGPDLTGTITAFTAENPTEVTTDAEDEGMLTVGGTITLEALTGDQAAMDLINGQIVEVLSVGPITLALDLTGATVEGLTADYVRNEEAPATASAEEDNSGWSDERKPN
jgi:hypothetical protein